MQPLNQVPTAPYYHPTALLPNQGVIYPHYAPANCFVPVMAPASAIPPQYSVMPHDDRGVPQPICYDPNTNCAVMVNHPMSSTSTIATNGYYSCGNANSTACITSGYQSVRASCDDINLLCFGGTGAASLGLPAELKASAASIANFGRTCQFGGGPSEDSGIAASISTSISNNKPVPLLADEDLSSMKTTSAFSNNNNTQSSLLSDSGVKTEYTSSCTSLIQPNDVLTKPCAGVMYDFGSRVTDKPTTMENPSGRKPPIFHKNILFKTEICRNYLNNNGYCARGPRCQFAHGPHDYRNPETHPLYRSKMCNALLLTGVCAKGDKCFHAHSEEERERRVSYFQSMYNNSRQQPYVMNENMYAWKDERKVFNNKNLDDIKPHHQQL